MRIATLGLGVPLAMAGLDCLAAAAADGRDEARLVLFGSLDAGRSAFVSAGAKVAPEGLDRDGIVVMPTLGGDLRQAGDRAARAANRIGAAPPRHDRTALAGLLAGWQWAPDWGSVAVFAGGEAAVATGGGPRSVHGPSAAYGARIQAEIWARPRAATLFTATLVAGSARASIWGRLSWGIRALAGLLGGDGAYLGPEASLYAERSGYTAWRLGLHATDAALGSGNVSVSAGWTGVEKVRHPGPYATLTAWFRL
jgi:hypothetical protein